VYGSLWKEVIVQPAGLVSSYTQDYGAFGEGAAGKTVCSFRLLHLLHCICPTLCACLSLRVPVLARVPSPFNLAQVSSRKDVC
jgi:hypothetical protein